MMKRLLATTATLALVALYGAGAYAADTDSGVMNMSGDVADTCSLDGGTQGAVTNATYAAGDLEVTDLANGTTAVGQAFSAAIDFAAMCNFAHTVTLTSTNGGMVVDAEPTNVYGTLDSRVNYQVALTSSANAACAAAVGFTTDGSLTDITPDEDSDTGAVDGACSGTLTVTVTGSAGTNPLLTGAYADTLTLTVGPTV